MKHSKTFRRIALLMCVLVASAAFFSCKKKEGEVRFASVSWTCVTTQTELAVEILETLGYDASNKMVSVPIAFQALDSNEADIFLGVWMPTMKTMANEYYAKGNMKEFVTNTEGAKYTLAVPTYVAEGGLTHFSDIAKYGEKLNYRIYGIEEGNDGNQVIEDMINADMFGLGDFELIPSSETGMLSEVRSAIREGKWIVFLGWSPHWMNKAFDMTYLKGSDENTFGPNNGTATVYTAIRTGFDDEQPNVAQFLKNYKFPISMMNEIMLMLDEDSSLDTLEAGLIWVKDNPEIYKQWLDGVTTKEGDPALPVFEEHLESI